MLLETKQKRNKKRLVEVKRLLALCLEEMKDYNNYRVTKDEIRSINRIDAEVKEIKLITTVYE